MRDNGVADGESSGAPSSSATSGTVQPSSALNGSPSRSAASTSGKKMKAGAEGSSSQGSAHHARAVANAHCTAEERPSGNATIDAPGKIDCTVGMPDFSASSGCSTAVQPALKTFSPVASPLVGVAASLLNLEVKVLTQPLGAENEWAEQGDGRVIFCDFTIRVVEIRTREQIPNTLKGSTGSSSPATSELKDAGAGSADEVGNTQGDGAVDTSAGSDTVSEFEDNTKDTVTVILEDTICSDTPFVGENCCIVWNSFEKQLSLCLMYASEEGYAASWSALVALQDKSYPPFRYDLLERCRNTSGLSTLSRGDSSTSPYPSAKAVETALPYAFYIHTRYDPPLGFIEQHALSLTLIEHEHVTNPALYSDKDTVLAMLSIATADLLDRLNADDTFPLLLTGLRCMSGPWSWSAPESLHLLHIPAEVTTLIRKDRRIGFLQHVALPGCCTGDCLFDLLGKYVTMSRRVRNEIVCTLLTSDSVFAEACAALLVMPPVIPNSSTGGSSTLRARRASLEMFSPTGSLSSESQLQTNTSCPGAPTSGSAPSLAESNLLSQKAEQQVLAHLRFFRELVTLSIAELGRDTVGPIVSKVYQCGLLEALSLVAERFGMPAGSSALFAKGGTESSNNSQGGARRGGSATANLSGNNGEGGLAPVCGNYYSPAVEQELAALLDATLVRLNERQEERLMNELVRTPILLDPQKYNGLVTFMLRQLVCGGAATGMSSSGGGAPEGRHSFSLLLQSRRILRDSLSSPNPFALFHVLGLHDDEGSAASERTLDAENADVRNRFHNFLITKYITPATRGLTTPVPPPPSLGSGGGGTSLRNVPIVQFSNAGVAHSSTGRSVSSDANGNGTAITKIGVSHTGPGSSGGGADGIGSCHISPVLPLPQGITSAFLRMLEYMVVLANNANRELLLKMVFHHKSHILHFIEGVCDTLCGANGASGRCQVGLDVLCGCVRFLKTVVAQMALALKEEDDSPLPTYNSTQEPLSAQLITTICRRLTVERDTFSYLLKAYNYLGGLRRNSVFHSGLLALLNVIGTSSVLETEDSSMNNLRDVRDFLFVKHFTHLPELFAHRFRMALVDEVSARLGQVPIHSPNNSVSVLSSTAGSELLRFSSKIRFIDEVEAVSGGVDGTVVPTTIMSPAIVANLTSTEDKQRKRNNRNVMDQWTAAASHTMITPPHVRSTLPLGSSDEHVDQAVASSPHSNRSGSPITGSPHRPRSGDHSEVSRPVMGNVVKTEVASRGQPTVEHAAISQRLPRNGNSEEARTKPEPKLHPTVPKEEKPLCRPRNFASVLENSLRSAGDSREKHSSDPDDTSGSNTPPPTSSLEKMAVASRTSNSVPRSQEDANGGSPEGKEVVVLPRIRRNNTTPGKRS